MTKIRKLMLNAPKCPACGKKKYPGRQVAIAAARVLSVEKGVPVDAYYCRDGHCWHIGRSNKQELYKIVEARRDDMITKNVATIGIDPGQTGAIALVSGSNLSVWDYTSIETAADKISALNERFDIKFAILEKVWPQPNDEPKRLNVLIRNAAMWDTLLHINDIPHEEYAPSTWRAGLVSKRKRYKKENYILTASRLFPAFVGVFTRHDRAEAALMAYRAWRHVEAGWETRKKA